MHLLPPGEDFDASRRIGCVWGRSHCAFLRPGARKMRPTLQCIGAAQTVTGSRHLLRTGDATVLLDCGLYQGRRAEARQRNERLGFEASEIDAVVLSHAHIDHSGALPLLCRHGFRGPIYATPATRDLCAVMLEDAALIQAADARYLNRAIERDHLDAEPISPLYDTGDVAQTLAQIVPVAYHQPTAIAGGTTVTFLDAGHVLGSAIVVLDVQGKRLVFTGDLGRRHLPILRDPEIPAGAHLLMTESTYGDRLHPPIAEMDTALAEVISRTAARGGKVVIPSFALERAQEVIYSLKGLRAAKRIPPIPVYVDSPLTVSITDVFRRHPDCYDSEARAQLMQGEGPFDFPGLRYVSAVEESMAIDTSEAPCVVISASGMCEAGRVLHHLKATIGDRKNTVVLVGFQAQHTLGRRIAERRPRIRVFGVERDLNCEVVSLQGFSAHADQRDLIAFAERVRAKGALQKVVLVHGEPAAQEVLAQALKDRTFSEVIIPQGGDTLTL